MKQPSIRGRQIGDKVQLRRPIKRGKRSLAIGFIESIDGAYHYIRLQGVTEGNVVELYDNEFTVVRRYTSRVLSIGQNVKLLSPDKLKWGRSRPRLGGRVLGFCGPYAVVQTIAGAGKSLTFLIRPGDLEKCDKPLVTPPAPRHCQHCGGDLRKPKSA